MHERRNELRKRTKRGDTMSEPCHDQFKLPLPQLQVVCGVPTQGLKDPLTCDFDSFPGCRFDPGDLIDWRRFYEQIVLPQIGAIVSREAFNQILARKVLEITPSLRDSSSDAASE
jgi:hypothetical protein